MLDKILSAIFGSKRERDVKQLLPIVEKINDKEEWAKSLNAEDFPKQTERFKEMLKNGTKLDDLIPEAFAADHLTAGQGRTHLPADSASWRIGNPCQRRQQKGIVQLQTADVQCICIFQNVLILQFPSK